MFRNYFKVAIRSLLKQRIYSIINVVGLSTGIASCLMIMLYVMDEFSYDDFWQNSDRIYKMVLERKYPNHVTHYAVIPHSFADAMMDDFAEVEVVTRLSGPFGNAVVTYKDEKDEVKSFEEDKLQAADSAFFRVFSLKLLKGDSSTILTKPNEIVLTQETADRYFGSNDPLNKVITIFGDEFRVSGVCENIPDNSHVDFDFLGSWATFPFNRQIIYTTFTAHVYVRLAEGADPNALESKFPGMVDTYAAPQIEQDLGKSWEDYKKEGNGYRYYLQPLPSIHLDPAHIESKMKPEGGNLTMVYALIGIAALILVIACINFMNLATARSSESAREVGVRKALGSARNQLRSQFLFESVLLSLFATAVAVMLVQLSLPFFNDLMDKHLQIDLTGILLPMLLALAIGAGLMAGSYPAFVLSSFNPVLVMKGNFAGSHKGAWLRNGLVVFQFAISIALIAGTLIVQDQMQFLRNKQLGFDKDQMLIVERVNAMEPPVRQTFIEELRRLPGVESVGSTFSVLGREGDFFGAQYQAKGSSEILTTKNMGADDYLAETVQFELVGGRWFSVDTNDSLNIILNETAVKTMGLVDPVGQKIDFFNRTPEGRVIVEQTIIGVVKDFNFQTLRDPVTPLVIQSNEAFGGGVGLAYARLQGGSIQETINKVEAKWKELAPDLPFKFMFLDEEINSQYQAEAKNGQILAVFSVLAILIACVGLFGLAAYTASLRTKEIGIRKVLGSSVQQVVFLLSKDLTRLVLVAFLLAVPVSWFVMTRYFLDSFTYKINLGPQVFLIAGGLALLIAWITVSYQSIRAALANPVKSLRSE